jgi:hypothetical protein
VNSYEVHEERFSLEVQISEVAALAIGFDDMGDVVSRESQAKEMLL